MTEKAQIPVGSIWNIGSETKVVRPDGVEVEVTDGLYVLTAPGTFKAGSRTIEATEV